MILFGEHAVVSGEPALGSAIGLRAYVRIEPNPEGTLIDLRDLGLSVKGFSVDHDGDLKFLGSSDEAARAARYVSAVIKDLDVKDVRITVSSKLPVASGLGSSAAIVVATIAALNTYQENCMQVSEIARTAHRIEKSVQLGLGSAMDTAISAYGGYQIVSSAGIKAVDLPSIRLAVGSTSRPHDTRAEVARVQTLRSEYPEIIDPLFRAIGSITRRSITCLEERRLDELGSLMNMNQGLLEAIGVSTRELCDLVYAARGAGGARGAKLTGAGGGGSMIALPGSAGELVLLTAIVQARGAAFIVDTGCDGVRIETDGRGAQLGARSGGLLRT